MKFDLHVHTDISYDSYMSYDELIKAAKARGLSGVAVTNHNTFRSAPMQNELYFIPAAEFSTDVGHLLVYFLKDDINHRLPRDDSGRFYWRDVCKSAHDQGALVFLAHPFSPKKIRPDSLFSEIDGIEICNSRAVHSRIHGANEKAIQLSKDKNKPFSAGSDAHCPDEVGTSYWECDLPDSAMNSPDFEEKLRRELLSGNGRVFAGCASASTVIRCKMRAYRGMGLIIPYLRSIAKLIIRSATWFAHRPQKGEYLNLKG